MYRLDALFQSVIISDIEIIHVLPQFGCYLGCLILRHSYFIPFSDTDVHLISDDLSASLVDRLFIFLRVLLSQFQQSTTLRE